MNISLSQATSATHNVKTDKPPMSPEDKVKELHDTTAMLGMRWGWMNPEGKWADTHSGCFMSIPDYFTGYVGKTNQVVVVPFHGDGAEISFEGLKNEDTFNKEMMAFDVPHLKFTGTPRSEAWVKYLMSSASPWSAVVPFIASQEPAFINNAGFVFKTPDEVPLKLTYNFLMAIRYAWEMPRNFTLFTKLAELMEPNRALFLSNFVTLNKDAKSIDGPYDAIYPWSFLESARLTEAGRFILAKPATVLPRENVRPNVFPLWQTTASKAEDDKAFAEFLELSDAGKLGLEEASGIVEGCVKRQSKAW